MRLLNNLPKALVLLIIGIITLSSCNALNKQDDYLAGTRWERVERKGNAFDLTVSKDYVTAIEFYGNRKMVFFYENKVFEGKYNIVDETSVSFNLDFVAAEIVSNNQPFSTVLKVEAIEVPAKLIDAKVYLTKMTVYMESSAFKNKQQTEVELTKVIGN